MIGHILRPFTLSLSKGARGRCFDKLSANGSDLPLFLVGEKEEQTSIGIVKKGASHLIVRGTALDYSYEAVAHTLPNKKMELLILTPFRLNRRRKRSINTKAKRSSLFSRGR